MKRSALIIGLVAALLVPASLAVAQTDDAPVTQQTRLGDGNQDECPYYLENGEPLMLRQHDGTQAQTGARWGEGPMGSEEAPFRNGYGPGECDGECDGPYGPQGTGNGYAHQAGDQDGTGPDRQQLQDDTGNQFSAGQGGNATSSPGGAANQRGPGGNK